MANRSYIDFRKQEFKFEKAAISARDYPKFDLPEFAFLGRSNVGKSSLINRITAQKGLAKTSKTPGRTQMAVFFRAGDAFRIVDLPGYGYAKLPGKKTAELSKVISNYLLNSENLRLLFLLLDSRRELKDSDLAMLEFCATNEVPVQIILTKSDKLTKSCLQEHKKMLNGALDKDFSTLAPLLPASSTDGTGINEIRSVITKLLSEENGNY